MPGIQKRQDKMNNTEEVEEDVMALEVQIYTILDNVCQQEAQKMSTFHILHDEKASKQ